MTFSINWLEHEIGTADLLAFQNCGERSQRHRSSSSTAMCLALLLSVWFGRAFKIMINPSSDNYYDHGFGDSMQASNSRTEPLLLCVPPQALDHPVFPGHFWLMMPSLIIGPVIANRAQKEDIINKQTHVWMLSSSS